MAGVGSIGSVTPLPNQVAPHSQRATRQPAADSSGSSSNGIIDVGDLPDGIIDVGDLPNGLIDIGDLPDGIIDVGDLPDGVSGSELDLSQASGLTDTERAYFSDAGRLVDVRA